MVTLILTLTMCVLLFGMIWAATYFYPWTGLLRFFQHYIPETNGCAGYHSFGCNRKEHSGKI